MATPYIAQQTVTDYGLRFASLFYSAKLAITTDTSLTIPGAAPRYKAIIRCVTGGEVWVALNATAAATAGTTFAATTSEMINGSIEICREVNAGDVVHFFSTTATTDVSVILYALGTNN
jgi:hypothetical protein